MNAKDAIRILEKAPPNAILKMADGAEILGIIAPEDGKSIFFTDELDDLSNNIESAIFQHEIFKMSMYCLDESPIDLDEFEIEMKDAGMEMWYADEDKSEIFFEDTDKFPYMIFDEPSWTLSTDSEATEHNGKLQVNLCQFREALHDYKMWKRHYMVWVDADGDNGHTDKLELEVVLYDPITTNDVSEFEYIKFDNIEHLNTFKRYIDDTKPGHHSMYMNLKTMREVWKDDL